MSAKLTEVDTSSASSVVPRPLALLPSLWSLVSNQACHHVQLLVATWHFRMSTQPSITVHFLLASLQETATSGCLHTARNRAGRINPFFYMPHVDRSRTHTLMLPLHRAFSFTATAFLSSST